MIRSERAHRTSASVRLLQATAFVSSLDRAAIAPLLVPIAHDLKHSVAEVTLAATAYLLTYGAMQMFWAAGSDRYGRVRTMRVSLVIAGVAGLASAVAPNLTVLVGMRALAGAAFAAAVPGALVYIGDTVPIRIRPMALADLATGIAAGFALGTLAAALISDQVGWRAPFAAIGALALTLAVLIGWLEEPKRPPATSIVRQLPDVFRDRSTLVVLALAFLEGSLVLGLLVFLPATLQLSGVPNAQAGAATAVYGLVVIFTSALVKRRTTSAIPHRVLAAGGVMAVVAFAFLGVASTPFTVLTAAACLGASWAQMHTALQAWATEVQPHSRGVVVSAFASSLFLGSAVGTWVGGRLLADGHATLLFFGAAALATVLTATATVGRKRQPF